MSNILAVIVYNLTESIDLEATNAKVEKYKKENEELIISQQTKRQDDAKNQQANIQNEKRQMELLQMNLKVCCGDTYHSYDAVDMPLTG